MCFSSDSEITVLCNSPETQAMMETSAFIDYTVVQTSKTLFGDDLKFSAWITQRVM